MRWLRFLRERLNSLPQATADRGAWAEARAERHLRGEGLELVARNYRCRDGEIDLIMRHGDTLVFVEVRYRATQEYGGALASVGAEKRRRILRCARFYLGRHPRDARRPCRFDVVAVDGEHLEWIQNAFSPGLW